MIILGLLTLTSLVISTLAWPYGAGSCPEGRPAVGGSHLSNKRMIKGTLHQGKLIVSLDGVVLAPGATANFTAGVDHKLTLTALGAGNKFSGLLFRLGGNATTTSALQVPNGENELHVAQLVCVEDQKAGGVTHKVVNDWTQKTVTLRMDEDATDLPLDVTVVGQNDDKASIWFYSAYTLNAVGGNVTSSNSSVPGGSSLRGKSDSSLTSQPDNASSSTSASIGFIAVSVLLGLVTAVSFVNLVKNSGWLKQTKQLEG